VLITSQLIAPSIRSSSNLFSATRPDAENFPLEIST
jgi:hypothetical protein